MLSFVGVLFSALLIASTFWVGRPSVLQGEARYLSPPRYLEYFGFGFQMPMADSLWIRAIQDLDFCEHQMTNKTCQGRSWLFQMLDSITNLAPDHQEAYVSGGLALTVLISDYPGASKIFDKGVAIFPSHYRLVHVAAYHALVEEKNSQKAGQLLIQAAKLGGPPWFYQLAARLLAESGRREMVESLYQQLRTDSSVPENILEKIKEKAQ